MLFGRDRIRTSVNVIGDAFGAGIVYHLSKAELAEQDRLRAEREAQEAAEEFARQKALEEEVEQARGKSDLYPSIDGAASS